MKKIWVNKAKSFKEAERFDNSYYLSMSRTERLETMQFLREIYYKIKGLKNEGRKGLRRVIKIIQ
ncbi:MAG: hypothetical protein ABID09_01590 [Candidatus Omnitrophota bacterium]